MTTVKTVLVKGRSSLQGGYPLVVQVLHHRKKKVVYTGYSIPLDAFDFSRNKVMCVDGQYSSEFALQINRKCDTIIKSLNRAISILEKESDSYEVGDIFRVYGLLTREVGFYTYFRSKIRELDSSGHEGTARAYESTLNSLQKHSRRTDFPLRKVSAKFISEYRQRLLASGVCENTVGFYLHNIKAVYRKGCRELGLDLLSPFVGLGIKVEKTMKRSLTASTVRKIARLELRAGTGECLARDIFMFSFYTRGMAFIDIALLKKTDVFPELICYKRHKTGQLIQIGINKQIGHILNRYVDTAGEYVFPLVLESSDPYSSYKTAYHRIRYSLRKIKSIIGMDIPLRLHAARHSWAMIARESGASIQIIGECLGHTSENTTRIYLKELDRSVLDKVNNNVADCIG